MRIIIFTCLFFGALFIPPQIIVAFSILYMARWYAVELLPAAVCIDMYFGVEYLPYYTIFTVITLLLVEWLKPKLSFYTE